MMHPCRKCLLADIPSEKALAESIREVISLMPPEKRADEATRCARLNLCRTCERLNQGTCALCGCYVELRTAKIHMHCPDIPARW